MSHHFAFFLQAWQILVCVLNFTLGLGFFFHSINIHELCSGMCLLESSFILSGLFCKIFWLGLEQCSVWGYYCPLRRQGPTVYCMFLMSCELWEAADTALGLCECWGLFLPPPPILRWFPYTSVLTSTQLNTRGGASVGPWSSFCAAFSPLGVCPPNSSCVGLCILSSFSAPGVCWQLLGLLLLRDLDSLSRREAGQSSDLPYLFFIFQEPQPFVGWCSFSWKLLFYMFGLLFVLPGLWIWFLFYLCWEQKCHKLNFELTVMYI